MSKLAVVQNVQTSSGNGVTVASQAITLTSTLLNSTIVVVVQGRTLSTNPVLTASDNLSNTYSTIAGTSVNLGSQGATIAFVLWNAPAGITSVTISTSVNAYIAIQTYEIAGLQPNYVTATQSTGSVSPAATGPTAKFPINEYCIGWTSSHSSSGIGSSTNWTMETELDSSSAPTTGFRAARRGPIVTFNTISWSTTVGATPWAATIMTFRPLEPFPNNYQFVSAGNGMSVTEKIK